jgi:phenylacetate-CoA ligase
MIMFHNEASDLDHSQGKKLKNLVDYARFQSDYYRDLYHLVPKEFASITELPITNKTECMNHFDGWVTDDCIRLTDLTEFVADPGQIGSLFMGKYHVAVTSGTTGKNGIFLSDPAETKLSSEINLCSKLNWIGVKGLAALIVRGVRIAAVTAVGEHYGFISGVVYMRSRNPFWADRLQVFSIHDPLAEMVERLNAYQPTLLMGYASMISLLAGEQAAGHLHIAPVLVEVMSEKLTEAEFERVASVFKVNPYQMYGATEIPFACPRCKFGWYHQNTDLVILEPMDEQGRWVKPGELSHSLLITNLVNRTQPMIRYDIGDRILMKSDRCACGNPRPAFQVQGRTADTLVFHDVHGRQVLIPSLMFVTLIDRFVPGVDAFQVVQTEPATLEIRLQYPTGFSDEMRNRQWEKLELGLQAMLVDRGLGEIDLVRTSNPPHRARGGKVRMVVPYNWQ